MLNVLKGLPVDKTPIWLMRQAGRYLPEYKQTRSNAGSFLDLCTNPKLACEVTLQPLKRFDLDAAIIFSDILTIPYAYNLGLDFLEKKGPVFKTTINSDSDFTKIKSIDVKRDLDYVFSAIDLTRAKLNKNIPLIGFAGSPWTVATYMVEGQTSKAFNKIKAMLYSNPSLLSKILDRLTIDTIEYASYQIDAGANIFMIFDTWGGILTKDAFLEHSLSYIDRIVKSINNSHPDVPVIVFSKNGGKHLQNIIETGCRGVGLDWTASISEAKSIACNKVAIQGNLDPTILYADKHTITEEVNKILSEVGPNTRHIFNLGHGILPDIEINKVSHLVSEVHKQSEQLVQKVIVG